MPCSLHARREADLTSNKVLALVAPHLAAAGFTIEPSKKAEQKINVPFLFGLKPRCP
jgi:hypothetical protein